MSTVSANLLDLPIELFRKILADAVRVRGLKRAMRLRLVNKLFSAELLEALCESGLIDGCYQTLDTCPWARPYVENLLVERRTSSFPTLHCIRKVVERLVADKGLSDESSYQNYALRLLRLAGTGGHQALRSLLLKSQGAYKLRNFDHDLLAAAIFMNHNVLAEQLAKRNVGTDMRAFGNPRYPAFVSSKMGTFGHPFKAAVMSDNYTAWDFLASKALSRPYKWKEGVGLLDLVTKMGTPEMVRYIADPRISTKPLLNMSSILAQPRSISRYVRATYGLRPLVLNMLLQTPNVETFHMVLKQLREAYIDPLKENERCLNWLLSCAAISGWSEMTRHLLALGARAIELRTLTWASENGHDDVVSVLLDHKAEVNSGELKAAASYGKSSTVRILLDRGVDIPLQSKAAEGCLYAAARKGFRDIIQMLLDAGADPNAGSPSPLVGAIATEHSAMFRLLVERGAVVTPILPQLEEVAKSSGLESMQALLQEYKVG